MKKRYLILAILWGSVCISNAAQVILKSIESGWLTSLKVTAIVCSAMICGIFIEKYKNS